MDDAKRIMLGNCEVLPEKKILDVTCGGRSIWFDKHHPADVYCDKRKFKFEKIAGSENDAE